MIDDLLNGTIVLDEGFLISGGLSLSSWSDWSPLSDEDEDEFLALDCGGGFVVDVVAAIFQLNRHFNIDILN